MSTTYGIRDIANYCDVTHRTLRFYESLGLIKPARNGMERIYTEKDRSRIMEIVALTKLGFTLREIRSAPLSRKALMAQLDLVRRQRASLDEAILELNRRVAACARADGTGRRSTAETLRAPKGGSDRRAP